MARETNQHRVILSFDDGVSAKLICPESGCLPGLTCGQCGRDLQDPESTPCYDCSDGFKDECWVKTWFDNVGADELLKGSAEVTIDAEWEGDHMVANIVPAAGVSPRCETPGGVYEVSVGPDRVKVSVKPGVPVTESQAADIEAQLHAAVEGVLSGHWKPSAVISNG